MENTTVIRCAKCGTINVRHLTLCERCGEALYLKCRRCGERNTRDRRYCAICGRSLRGLFRWRQKDKRRFTYLILGAVIAVAVGYLIAKSQHPQPCDAHVATL